jgi:hypothetical protein
LDGLICAIPASLRIGIEISLAPELNSPRYTIARRSEAAWRAFAAVWPGSHSPATAVASFREM